MDNQAIYFIEDGDVLIFKKNPKSIPIQKKGKGDFFGDVQLYSGKEKTESAISLIYTTLLMITQDEFLKIIKEHVSDLVKNIFVLNLVSSPVSGIITWLVNSLTNLNGKLNFVVI